MLGAGPPGRQTPADVPSARSKRPQPASVAPRSPALSARATWLIAAVAVTYVGVRGGGYATTIWGSAGVIVVWAVLLGALLGLGGGRRPTGVGWVVILSLGLLAAWSAVGLIWSESGERTLSAVARDATYLGVLTLGIGAVRRRQDRHLLGGVVTGIVAIAAIALLSRLHPAWFPATATSPLLPGTGTQSRLSYPVDYWNALAELTVMAVPLVWSLGTRSQNPLRDAALAATLPVLVLTIALTLSRGGLAALVFAAVTYLLLAPWRASQLLTALVGGAGGGLLTAIAFGDHALRQGLTTAQARHQGNVLLGITVVVCVLVGLVQFGFSVAQRRGVGERISSRSVIRPELRARAPLALTTGLLLALAIFLVAGGAHRLSRAWASFKHPAIVHNLSPARFTSLSGHGRYQFWRASLSAFERQPLHGIGAGTWEFWWTRHGDVASAGYAQNAHSLVFETLAETGIPGGLLIVLFLGAALLGTVLATRRAERIERAQFAAIAASTVAFLVAALTDWVWQVPVIPICFLLLAAPALSAEGEVAGTGTRTRARLGALLGARMAVGLAAVAALVVIAIPLETASAIQQSQQAVARGSIQNGLRYARTATRIEPYGASSWMQEAAVLEVAGDLRGALRAALRAQSNEPDNWRPPLIVARVEAERGDSRAAVSAARRALLLNPSLATLLG